MANSIKFDRAEVISKAQQLFWQRGFNGTSMRDLLDAVNLRPGSLYASFGDKESLYHEALLHYAEKGQQAFASAQAQHQPALETLKRFVRSQVLGSQHEPSQVCMLVKTVAELSAEGSALAELAKTLLQNIEFAFKTLLEQAVAEGAALSAPPERLSRTLQAQIIGLKTYAQLKPEPAVLEAMVDDILAGIEKPPAVN
ncbi:TetR/AcrR family transcriptional regulator [Alishewanella sp. HL-SH05]|uniref:TetR/AcrR family transcriptional regulator n=1 Tax=Alishewanella sp. HL-SH05 TaxID=3461145 RepID=UPI004042BE84